MRVSGHRVNLQRSAAVTDHVLPVDAFDRRGTPARLEHRVVRCEPVRRETALARMEQHVLIELAIAFVRHDDCTLSKIRTQPARVIEVMMRVHDIADGLARHEPSDFLDDGK